MVHVGKAMFSLEEMKQRSSEKNICQVITACNAVSSTWCQRCQEYFCQHHGNRYCTDSSCFHIIVPQPLKLFSKGFGNFWSSLIIKFLASFSTKALKADKNYMEENQADATLLAWQKSRDWSVKKMRVVEVEGGGGGGGGGWDRREASLCPRSAHILPTGA